MAKEGIRFITNANVGQDISAEELYKNNDAVLLCMGATRPRDLPIPGRQSKGIHFAMEFLQSWQQFQWGDQVDSISGTVTEIYTVHNSKLHNV